MRTKLVSQGESEPPALTLFMTRLPFFEELEVLKESFLKLRVTTSVNVRFKLLSMSKSLFYPLFGLYCTWSMTDVRART